MNWDAIGAIAEVLGAVGVIASLVYLAGQVRSSGNQAKAAADQSRQAAVQSVVNKMNDSMFRPYEELYHYRQEGLVNDWIWQSIGTPCRAIMGTQGFEDWWEARNDWFSGDFRQHVDAERAGNPAYLRHAASEEPL